MIKRLTFVRRGDAVPAAEFAARWAEWSRAVDDGVPVASRPRRLVHCVVRPGRVDRAFHGVSIAWFADEAALTAYDRHRAGTSWGPVDAQTHRDVVVDARTVDGEEELASWWTEPAGDARMLLLGLVRRNPRLTPAEFAGYWWDEHRPLAKRVVPAELQPPIYVHNYVRPNQRCDWDGIAEFYDESLDRVRARAEWVGSPESAEIVRDEMAFLDREHRDALLTDAYVLRA